MQGFHLSLTVILQKVTVFSINFPTVVFHISDNGRIISHAHTEVQRKYTKRP